MLRTISYSFKGYNRSTIYLNPQNSKSEEIKVDIGGFNIPQLYFIAGLLASGFRELPAEGKYRYLLPCPLGTFSNSSSQGTEGCIPCPPGGFYSDDEGYMGASCKKCPNGSFVALDKAPGTKTSDCKSCPEGTETDVFAGLRACQCLRSMYRTHMFKECSKCGQGLECKNDYATLKPGYWWKWKNMTHKRHYKYFVNNLLAPLPALGEDDVQYPYPIPIQYNCPIESSCKGGLDSQCANGYEGPLCAVCSSRYYKQLQICKRCPSKKWIALQLSIVAGIVFIILAFSVWLSKRNKENNSDTGRSPVDIFLAKVKIIIGFYQVTFGLLEAFSYIKWPASLQIIGKYSEVLQLNILQVAPVQCLFTELRVDAFGNLFAMMVINAAAIAVSGAAYRIQKALILKTQSLKSEEKSKRISQTKELAYRSLFFVLYVTYLGTCYKTAILLPFACRTLCKDDKDEICPRYLRADYSTRCHDKRYNRLVVVVYLSAAYVIALPAAALVILWRKQRPTMAKATHYQRCSTELITGLRFLFESYKPRSWFWELVEMSRKVIVTSGLTLVGRETRSYIGVALAIAGMYGMLFCWVRPLKDVSENRLMSASLAVTVINLVIGAVSRIPDENFPIPVDPYVDTVIFNILVVGANTLVIGLLVAQYAVHLYQYLKEWLKNPYFSFSCCLDLFLPLINLPGEIGDITGLAGTSASNTQLDTGHVEMSTVVGALNDKRASGATPEDDGNRKKVQERNCKDPQLQTLGMDTRSLLGNVKDSQAIVATLKQSEHGEDNCHRTRYRNVKHHRETQTELWAKHITD